MKRDALQRPQLPHANISAKINAIEDGRLAYSRLKLVQLLQGSNLRIRCPKEDNVTPMLMVIVMITVDFLAMSLTTGAVRPSKTPNSWQIGRTMAAGVILGVCFLVFSTAIVAIGKFQLHLGIEVLQTLSVVGIVFGSQATTYVIRRRQHLWGLRPSFWLVLSSVADVLIISTLAALGIAMAPLPISVNLLVFAAATAFGMILHLIKIPVFSRLCIS